MSAELDVQLHFEIERLVHQTWWNTDAESGVGGESFFTPDAVIAMPARSMSGQGEIVAGLKARLSRGPRLSRHLVQNLVVDPTAVGAIARYAILLYAANGVAPMEIPGFQAIADVDDDFVLQDGRWLIRHRRLTTVFTSPASDSIMLIAAPKGS